MRYVLPIVAVIETMKQTDTIVRLHARLPALPGHKGEGAAELTVGQGKIHSCTITTKGGLLLFTHVRALKLLEQCGDLEWELISQEAGDQGTQRGEDIPCRSVLTLSPAQRQILPRRAQQVFALVDGQRSVEAIARLLSLSPVTVQEILQQLRNVYAVQYIDHGAFKDERDNDSF